jgi:hypothetical protein
MDGCEESAALRATLQPERSKRSIVLELVLVLVLERSRTSLKLKALASARALKSKATPFAAIEDEFEFGRY